MAKYVLTIVDSEGKKKGQIELDLDVKLREDIFKRAVFAERSLFFQKQGADPMAGKNHAISLSKRRRKFRTTYGRGGSRTPKKVMWRRGTQLRFVGAFAPNTVGGRKAHAPTAEKNTLKLINMREWIYALKVGLLASFESQKIAANGQKLPETYPLVLDSAVEQITKTKDAVALLEKIGFGAELSRIESRTIRAGKGTMRGRTYRVKRGPLVVVSDIEAPLLKALRNIRGVDVVIPELLLVSDFGMSEIPGRAVLFTQKALENFKPEVLE